MILPLTLPRRAERPMLAVPQRYKENPDRFHDFEPKQSDFLSEAIEGLSKPQKSLPSKFFYDETGSALFDDICQLDEYYPTRTEQMILDRHSLEISDLVGANCHLAEFGSGSSLKVRTLIKAFENPVGYVPIDISREHLIQAADSFSNDFPTVPVTAICADYTANFELPTTSGGRYV